MGEGLRMKYTSGHFGRIFVLRLEDGDSVHECIETVARRETVQSGICLFVGGADTGFNLLSIP